MRLIYAETFLEALENADADVCETYPDFYCDWGFSRKTIEELLLNIPTIEAKPVVHGRWDDSGRYKFPSGETAVRCTNCGCALHEYDFMSYNWYYCPCCGAKMDGEREET